MIKTILTDRTGYEKTIKEVRQEWLADLLEFIGLDIAALDQMPPDAAVEYFVDNEVEVIEYLGIGAMKVKQNGEMIGEWAGPDMVLKEDSSGALYFEVKVETWSIIEEQIDTQE